MNTPSVDTPKTTGRAVFLLGLVLALLGPLAYVGQLQARRLTVPWYLPVLGTAGSLLMVLALVRSRSIPRMICVVLFGLLAGFQWYVLLSMSKLAPYAGPVEVGKPFPAFATTWADGSPFTQADLTGAQKTIMVFFRGRW